MSALPPSLRQLLPRLGAAGSRSAELHDDHLTTPTTQELRASARLRFFFFRWLGTVGSLLMAFGALGAGAIPVVGNPYGSFPGGALLAPMLHASSIIVFLGVGLLVLAWLGMAPLVGAPLRRNAPIDGFVAPATIWGTFVGWVLPLLLTAPLFTQDIYSYLAQGSIVAHGMDPYQAGPLQLLGPENDLARSVPFIWANSPSPYGPVALGVAALISLVTHDSIVAGVLLHRLVAVLGVIAAGWAITQLSRRCSVATSAALWLGILNPLVILHLIGGIHNEALMLGLILVGLEWGLRGITRLPTAAGWWWLIGSGVLISGGGMVKVTGFMGLGFIGMALARRWRAQGHSHVAAIAIAAGIQLGLLLASVIVVSVVSTIGPGWITGQGGAVSVRSWMSMTTDIGVISGWLGMLLGLGDHTEAILTLTRTIGVLIAGGFALRLLFATYRGAISPVGGLGVTTFVVVVLFPVVHPWYILWAILPLAAWANRRFFRLAVVGYSAVFSFFVLPRGLGLPPLSVLTIYCATFVGLTLIVIVGGWLFRRWGWLGLH